MAGRRSLRHLSRGLVELGHDVEVFRQPYPGDPSIPGSGSPRCPASTLTANLTCSGYRVPARSATASTCQRPRRCGLGLPEPRTFSSAAPRDRFARRRDESIGSTTTSAWAPACGISGERAAGGGHRAPPHHPGPRGPGRRAMLVARKPLAQVVAALHRCRRRSRAASPTC